jgi:D-hydroxyproline dehydrogenase subunit gamma
MPEQQVIIEVNGREISVREGASVAVAILMAGFRSRASVIGEWRTAVCGMGICYECRAEIDGVAHRKSCQVLCAPGMIVRTDEQR